MKRLDWNALDEAARRDALARPAQSRADELRRGVERIIAAVREHGDTALRELSAKYDRCTLGAIEVGQAVNIEIDVLARYLSRMRLFIEK